MKLIREEIEQVEVIVEERNGKKTLHRRCFPSRRYLQPQWKHVSFRNSCKEVSRYNEGPL